MLVKQAFIDIIRCMHPLKATLSPGNYVCIQFICIDNYIVLTNITTCLGLFSQSAPARVNEMLFYVQRQGYKGVIRVHKKLDKATRFIDGCKVLLCQCLDSAECGRHLPLNFTGCTQCRNISIKKFAIAVVAGVHSSLLI